MPVNWEVGPSEFEVKGFDLNCEENARLEEVVASLAGVLRAHTNCLGFLNADDKKVSDAQYKATMAQLIRLEALINQLSQHADLLNELQNGTVTPTEAGFPEFEISGY